MLRIVSAIAENGRSHFQQSQSEGIKTGSPPLEIGWRIEKPQFL
jgi:uncharacterized FAD-dependent dehydrogenase